MKNNIFLFLPLILLFSFAVCGQNGTYFRSDDYGKGDVTFKKNLQKKSKILNFEISIAGARSGACIGGLKGKAKWIDANVAEFNGDFNERDPETGEAIGCRITFIFSGKKVIIREDGCNDYHGVSCQFEGTFVKK